MLQSSNEKPWDLEERTERFAARCRALVKRLPRTVTNHDDARQLGRCSGSVGANYIEANDALGKKDFVMEVRMSRREAKESRMFLRLLDLYERPDLAPERAALVQEADELVKILSSILKPFV
jgi:four helix bundle protein